MDREEEQIEKAVIRLNAKLLGVVCGLIFGFSLFVMTNFLVVKGGPVVGPHLALLGQFFPGYTVTFVGSMIGFVYAFMVGLVLGSIMGAVYNRVAGL